MLFNYKYSTIRFRELRSHSL